MDFKCAFLGVEYEAWQREAADRERKGLPKPPTGQAVSTQSLQSMLDAVRKEG